MATSDPEYVSDRPKVKMIVVGDPGVGKTSLIATFAARMFAQDGVPAVLLEPLKQVILVHGRSVELVIYDVLGGTDSDRHRQSFYPLTDVFIVLFAVDDRSSFKSVRSKWIPEMTKFCPNGKLILVGTKSDLRNPTETIDPYCISRDEIRQLSEFIGAETYLECSAKRYVNVKEVFESAVLTLAPPLDKDGKPKKNCTVQ